MAIATLISVSYTHLGKNQRIDSWRINGAYGFAWNADNY